MRIDIRRVFSDIKAREEENKDAKAFIEEKETECLEATRAPRDLIEWNEMVVNMFNNTRISVSLKDILDEIANITGQDREKFSVNVDVDTLGNYKKMTKSRWLTWLFEMKNKPRTECVDRDMSITINLDDKELANFIVPFDFKAIQNDGRRMYEHLDFVKFEEDEKDYVKDMDFCKAVIVDKENIMVDYTIKQLMSSLKCSGTPWIPGIVLQAILNINDRECGREVEMNEEQMK